MEIDFLPLFASNVFITKLDIDVTLLKEKSHEAIKAYQYETEKNIQQSIQVLDSIPAIRESLLEVFKVINLEFFKYRTGENGNDWKITTSWITKTNCDQDSQLHNHRNSFYSGVFYYGEYDDDAAKFEISTPLQYHGSYKMETDYDYHGKTPLETAESWLIPPEHQRLILFPSYLMHKVAMHRSQKPRESLAFNIVPVPPYGRGDSQILDLEIDDSYSLRSPKNEHVRHNDPITEGPKQSEQI